MLLGVAALLCLAAVVLAGALGRPAFSADSPLDRFRLGQAGPGSDADPADGAVVVVDPPPARSQEGIPVEVVVSLAVAVVLAALLVRSALRVRHDEVTDDPDPDEDIMIDDPTADDPVADEPDAVAGVAGAARRGLAQLDLVDPGQVVLACWVELEAAGERLGRGRTSSDTPTDFAARLAAALPGLDVAVLDDLRRSYSRVRYGRGPAGATGGTGVTGAAGAAGATVGPAEVRRARAALQHLLGVLDPGDPQGLPR